MKRRLNLFYYYANTLGALRLKLWPVASVCLNRRQFSFLFVMLLWCSATLFYSSLHVSPIMEIMDFYVLHGLILCLLPTLKKAKIYYIVALMQ